MWWWIPGSIIEGPFYQPDVEDEFCRPRIARGFEWGYFRWHPHARRHVDLFGFRKDSSWRWKTYLTMTTIPARDQEAGASRYGLGWSYWIQDAGMLPMQSYGCGKAKFLVDLNGIGCTGMGGGAASIWAQAQRFPIGPNNYPEPRYKAIRRVIPNHLV